MEEETSNDVTDLISQLPEPILQHILSFSEVKDAFRTCVLSKKWNSACVTFPFLNFGKCFLAPTSDDDPETLLQKAVEALNVVDAILMRCKQLDVGIQKFCLEMPRLINGLDLQPYINAFISSVMKENKVVKELKLVFEVGDYAGALLDNDGPPLYTLPEVIYDAVSLVKLDLEEFTLVSPSSGTIKFHSLRELHLSRTLLDNYMFQLLLMGCPQIEILTTFQMKGLDRVQVYGLPKLKRIMMINCDKGLLEMKIDAPNLEYLYRHDQEVLSEIDVNACKNLKHLTLSSIVINDKWMVDLLSNLPFLENFCLYKCWGLKIFRMSSNLLKILALQSCNGLEEVEVNAPHLCSFEYSGIISLTASTPEKMHFRIGSETDEIPFHEKLIEFLRNFNHCKEINLEPRCDIVELIIPKELREVLHPPLYGIKRLTVPLYISEDMPSDLLDSLLWIAPGLETLSVKDSLGIKCLLRKVSQLQIHFTYKTSIDEDENPSCSSSTAQKCGLNTLKKVKLVDFKGVDHTPFMNYFVEKGIEFERVSNFS